jgi:photosystem II stability/assembly factor-like uncharacterized protein
MRLKFIVCLAAFVIAVNAQWVKTGLTNVSSVQSIMVNNGRLYVLSDGNILISPDMGKTWKKVLSSDASNVLAVSGNNIYTGTVGGGVFHSADNGATWTVTGVPNKGLPIYNKVQCITVSGNKIFAGTYGKGIFLSTSNCSNWVEINSGLTNLFVNCIITNNNNVFAGTDGGVFRLIENKWVDADYGISDSIILCLVVDKNNIFAGTNDKGIYRSINNGLTWAETNRESHNNLIKSLTISGNNIFALTDGRDFDGNLVSTVYLSNDNGEKWIAINSGLPAFYTGISLFANTEYIFVGSASGVYYHKNANAEFSGDMWRRLIAEIEKTRK